MHKVIPFNHTSKGFFLAQKPIKMVCVRTFGYMCVYCSACLHVSARASIFSIVIFPNDSFSGLHILRADDGREPLLKIFEIVLTTPKIPFCWQPAGFIESYPVTTYTQDYHIHLRKEGKKVPGELNMQSDESEGEKGERRQECDEKWFICLLP